MQIDRHVHGIKIPFQIMGPSGLVERFVNVFMIYGTYGVCLIDTGVAGSEEAIYDYLRSTERKVSDIHMIIATHAHPDHIGAARTIKGDTACSVAAHPLERPWIEDVDLQAKERPIPDFHSLVAGRVPVDKTLEDGLAFDLGCGLKLQIFHTPGHSRGSISILFLGYMVLFSGDAIPVPGALPIYEDPLASIASIKKLKKISGLRYLCPSWDEPCAEKDIYRRMDEGLSYIQRTHEAVIKCAQGKKKPDPMELCVRVLEELGLPPAAANPLVSRTFMSHIPYLDRADITE
jgi:hydroxyacylglutathione hydrolase